METMGTVRMFENAMEAAKHDRGFKDAWHCALTRRAAFGDEDDLPQGDQFCWRYVSDRELAQEEEVDQLHADWALVVPAHDWKAELAALVRVPDGVEPEAFVERLGRAVEYFTATKAEVRVVMGGELVRVSSDGYRAGPAGDH